MSATWEQLEAAALVLVRSGSIKDRLADAWRNHLVHVEPEELPECVRAPFRACSEALTREPPMRGEDAVRATVRKMSGQQADEVACSVVRIFAEIVRETARIANEESAAVGERTVTGTTGRTAILKAVPQSIARYAEG